VKKKYKDKNYSLWKKALTIIPDGNMLLSKRPEMHLPGTWPSYYLKTKGCEVWDLNKRKFFDFYLMGVGTNILGYSNFEVDKAVRRVINDGNMSSLNCPEEVQLAEKLIEIHPWAEMVKLARTGGEANSIAIRIARAASGKDKVAVCGYHGWHDWYLSSSLLKKENLETHLLKDLNISGVPKALKGSIFPFEYNNFSQLLNIINQNPDIGVVKMEVSRNYIPKKDFLENIRKITTKRKIILVFDECTSAFRETFGGLHKKYNVQPDIAIFGKALGNGYAITAVIGKKEVMEHAKKSFISSTFWTERIGPVAALKTLEIMERKKSWKTVSSIGRGIKEKWKEFSLKYKIQINIKGLDSIPSFNFEEKFNRIYGTFLTQEMLKNNFLAGNSIYVCTEHKPNLLNKYYECLEEVFYKISLDNEFNDSVKKRIKGPLKQEGFKRLN
jgi:glutamate-1-semialdehyde 2,1-aminomutase